MNRSQTGLKNIYHNQYNPTNTQEDPQSVVFPPWVREGPSSCAFEGIRASPATHGYRNKSEFTVGWDADGAPTVGFRIGTYKVRARLGGAACICVCGSVS